MRKLSLHKTRLGQRLANCGLYRNSEGAAAVEFALIVPLMFFMFVGAVELSHALTVDRRVSQVASSTADLVSRADKVTTAELNDMMQIVGSLMEPYDATPMKVSIVSVKASPTDENDTKVDWAFSYNGGPNYSSGAAYPVPTGLMNKGTSVIVGEVSYNYTPWIFTYFIQNAFTMDEKFYLSPRTKSCVSLDNTNCVTGNSF